MAMGKIIVKYVVLFALVLGLAAVYLYRVEVFPEPVVSKIDSFVAQVKGMVQPGAGKPGDSTIASKNTNISDETQKNPVLVKAVNTTARQDEKIKPTSISKQEKLITPPPVQGVVQNPENTGPVSNSQLDAWKKKMETLSKARSQFFSGDYTGAVISYEALIKLDEGLAVSYGELGNVYYAMGEWLKAGESYYQAATRLLAQGHVAQVHHLQRVIQGLAPEKAAMLAEKMKYNR